MAIPNFFLPQKAPGDTLPFGFNWGLWFQQNAIENPTLADDYVASATITASPAGLTIGSVGRDATNMIASAVVSGGVDGQSYTLTCTINTNAGLIAVATETLQVTVSAR